MFVSRTRELLITLTTLANEKHPLSFWLKSGEHKGGAVPFIDHSSLEVQNILAYNSEGLIAIG